MVDTNASIAADVVVVVVPTTTSTVDVVDTLKSDASRAKLREARSLYASYFFAAWGDRMWQFSVFMFLLEIFPATLMPASLFGFCESMSGIIFCPSLGGYIDRTQRLPVIRMSICVQNVAISLASLLFAYAIHHLAQLGETGKAIVLALIILAGMVAKVASSLNKVSIHKDWAVVVSGGVRCVQTQVNANMRRVDMICNICAPLFVGVASSVFKPAATCLLIAAWALCSMAFEYYLAQRVYDAVPGLAIKPLRAVVNGMPSSVTKRSYIARQSTILRQFWHHRALGVSLPYAMLYLSVLSLSGTMVSYLRAIGVPDFWLAFGRALGACGAISSTFAVPRMVDKIGLIRTGVITFWALAACLTPVFLAFVIFANDQDAQHSVGFIVLTIACIVASRFGLWGFDLTQTQLMQELVEHEFAGAINGAQETVVNVCFLLAYGYTLVFADPADFVWPVVFSYVSIVGGALLFTRYWRVTGDEVPKIPRRVCHSEMSTSAGSDEFRGLTQRCSTRTPEPEAAEVAAVVDASPSSSSETNQEEVQLGAASPPPVSVADDEATAVVLIDVPATGAATDLDTATGDLCNSDAPAQTADEGDAPSHEGVCDDRGVDEARDAVEFSTATDACGARTVLRADG